MLYLVEYPENENFDSVLDTAWFAIGSRFFNDVMKSVDGASWR